MIDVSLNNNRNSRTFANNNIMPFTYWKKGDDDFIPSINWTGRRGGFEFKLGERGMGYYRTGKAVIVPSNMAYKI